MTPRRTPALKVYGTIPLTHAARVAEQFAKDHPIGCVGRHGFQIYGNAEPYVAVYRTKAGTVVIYGEAA